MSERILKVINHPLHRHLGITDARSEDGESLILMKRLKELLDPDNLLNPGKLF